MHARAFVVAGAMRDDLLTDLRQAVDKAISGGATLEAFRKDFDAIVERHGWGYNGGRDWRTRVIYETNLRTSYQAGRYQQMKAVAHRRPYWQYVHSPHVQDPRPEHLAWDGLILRHDDPWWDTHYPPNGWGCRCSVRTLAERDLKKMGRDGPDPAPAIHWETHTVGVRGPAPRTVKVPEGIDPGWGYNVGKAAWGSTVARQAAAESSVRGWERLTPGDWASHGRPKRLAPLPAQGGLGPHLAPDQIVPAIKAMIGGEEKVYTLEASGFRYPVLVDAELLGQHLAEKPDRTPFLPLLPELLRAPQEVWATFERHKATGKIALRLRMVKVLDVGKARPLMLVLDARRGMAVSYTFMPYAARKLNKVRVGWLLHGE